MNLTEIFGIQNNIFGYSIDYFIFYSEDDDNIKLGGINGDSIKSRISPDKPVIKAKLNENIFK